MVATEEVATEKVSAGDEARRVVPQADDESLASRLLSPPRPPPHVHLSRRTPPLHRSTVGVTTVGTLLHVDALRRLRAARRAVPHGRGARREGAKELLLAAVVKEVEAAANQREEATSPPRRSMRAGRAGVESQNTEALFPLRFGRESVAWL